MKIKKIYNMLRHPFGGKKEEEIDYPSDFAIVKFSEVAFETGVTDDSNKIIERNYYDSNGNFQTKIYRYSAERVSSFRKVLGIPVYDQTEKELEFPIVGRIEMGVVKYKIK